MPNGYGRRLCWLTLIAWRCSRRSRARRRPHPVQDRHLRAGRDHLPGVDGASGRARRQGRAESRIHQHGRRQPRRAGAVVRRNPGHACRAGAGGAGQQAGRRPAARHLDRQHHPDHDLRLAGDQDRADLKGKTIGISTFGSETDVAVSIALQRLGLKRDDVTVSQIGGSHRSASARSSPAASTPRRCSSRPSPRRSRRVLSRCSISPPPTRRGSLMASWSRTVI